MNRPIGIFDSGLGGISVLRDALRLLPTENFIYFGDNSHAPYGGLREADIADYALQSADFLAKRGVKAIIIACNTATATCISQIRDRCAIPVISLEPAIKPACALPGHGKILMLATLATTRLMRYLELQNRMPDPERIINVPCPGLVDRIEHGIFDIGQFDDLFDEYFENLEGISVAGVVLGCTHYIFIRKAIEEYMRRHFSGDIHFFDGNEATVMQLKRVLKQNHLLNINGSGEIEFHTSGDITKIEPLFEMLL